MKKPRKKETIIYLLAGIVGISLVTYSYLHNPFNEFLSYCALMVAAIAALAATLSLKYTRDTVRPFLYFDGTINLEGNPPEIPALGFPVTNSGMMPADNVTIRINPFETNEKITADNVSKRYEESFFASAEKVDKLSLFPRQTKQLLIKVDLTRPDHEQLLQRLLAGHVKLRINISYSGLGKKYRTISTVGFDKLSFRKGTDEKSGYFDGVAVVPQEWY
jgi:hypothetical protein